MPSVKYKCMCLGLPINKEYRWIEMNMFVYAYKFSEYIPEIVRNESLGETWSSEVGGWLSFYNIDFCVILIFQVCVWEKLAFKNNIKSRVN